MQIYDQEYPVSFQLIYIESSQTKIISSNTNGIQLLNKSYPVVRQMLSSENSIY